MMSAQASARQYPAAYNGTAAVLPSGKNAATRLDDAIAQLRNLKGAAGVPSASSSAAPPTISQVVLPGNSQSVTYRTVSMTSSSSGGGPSGVKSPPPVPKKPSIPPELRRPSVTSPIMPLTASTPQGKPEPSPHGERMAPDPSARGLRSVSESTTSYTSGSYSSSGKPSPIGSTSSMNSVGTSSVTFDAQGRCTCCPFGYHVDVDFVHFSQDMQHGGGVPQLKPGKKSPRMSVDSHMPTYNGSIRPVEDSWLLEDQIHPDSRPPIQRTIVRTQSAYDTRSRPLLPSEDLTTTSYQSGRPVPQVAASQPRHIYESSTESKPVTVTTVEETFYTTAPPKVRPDSEGAGSNLTATTSLTRSDSKDSIDSVMSYKNQVTTTRRVVTSTQLAETMATHLPDSGGNEALTISPESVHQIKQHISLSLQRMKELEDQVNLIPAMQERIARLKEDKRQLARQLQSKSGLSQMRSIGVGDYDIDEEPETRIEKVIQTVVQEAARNPTSEVGVGMYDVSVEYLTQAEAFHTIAEHVQHVKEKEIQSWLQEAQAQWQNQRASMRSVGVGENNVFEQDKELSFKEKEFRTIVIGQEQEKPEQRNVGLQVKPTMRDVCIEYTQQEDKPLTRTCGVNVDIADIMQEMAVQQQQQGQEMERTEHGEYQQEGALVQKNTWQTQKHVIQRKFMEAMTKGRHEDLVAFITGLLRRSVRSVGTTVKPTTSDFSSHTSLGHSEIGVGEDSVNVTVKPLVMTRDNFAVAKPTVKSQPTWTDLILTCDSACNTQVKSANKSVNTDLPECRKEVETITTTLNVQPAHVYVIEKEIRETKDESTNTLPQSFTTNAQTERKFVEPTYRTELCTRWGADQTKEQRMLFEPQFKTEENIMPSFNETVVEETVQNQRNTGDFQSSRKVEDNQRSDGDMQTITKTVTVTSQGCQGILGGVRSSSLVPDVMLTGNFGSRSIQSTIRETEPKTLVEQKTEISEDGAVSEVIHEVKSGPGMHSERTVKLVKKEAGGEVDGFAEGMQTFSEQTETRSFSSSLTSGSVLGPDFQKHKEEMMKLLSGEKEALSPISVDVAPQASSTAVTFTSRQTGSPQFLPSSSSVSPGGTVIEREGRAQRQYEDELRKRTSSTGVSVTPVTTSTRNVVSSSSDHGSYKQVVEEKESPLGMRREVTIESSFSTQAPFKSRLSDIDYFGVDQKGPKPIGHSERMQRYTGVGAYTYTSNANEERNKTELKGDPLKARYHIDELASPNTRVGHIETSGMTEVYGSQSSAQAEDESPRSIMKRGDKSPVNLRKDGVTFAEEVLAEQQQKGTEDGEVEEHAESDVSESDASEESFDEATYDRQRGEVSFECSADKTLGAAKSQEELDIDVELQAACSIVQQHLERGLSTKSSKVTSALSVIQQDWFTVASSRQSTANEVEGYLACFHDFSPELMEHVVNMTDGNGNTVLHYAVSHCNFAVVRVLVESGVADANMQNKAGYTPIMLVALADVATPEDKNIIQLLLSKGNVNRAASQAGQTALMLAVSHGRLEMVNLLLEAGADVNQQDEDGSTALMCATEHGHVDIVKALLSHSDIDISLKDHDGCTALEIALENGQTEIAKQLYAKDQTLKTGTNVTIKKRTASRIPSTTSSTSSSRAGARSSTSSSTTTRTTTKMVSRLKR